MKVLLTGAFSWQKEEIDWIKELGNEVFYLKEERQRISNEETGIPVEEIEAVIGNGIFLYTPIEQFKKLRYIQLTSAGMDRVPLEYVKEKKIILHNAAGVYSIPMAEWIVLKILEIYKKAPHFYRAQSERKWEKERNLLELYGKKALIVGMGEVGKETARRLKVFGVTVTASNRTRKTIPEVDTWITLEEVDACLPEADIVIVTLALTEQTKNFFHRERLTKMKKEAVFVNVARGGLVDEMALAEFMAQGNLLGAALDVVEHEPLPVESPLWKQERLLITPHNSYVSDGNRERLYQIIKTNLEKYLRDRNETTIYS